MRGSIVRVVVGAAVVAGGALVTPVAAEAQRRQQNLERVLVIPPIPRDRTTDSAYAVEFATELRDRFQSRVRNDVTVVSNEQYCEALTASGFDCGFLPDNNSSEQLGRFLQADAYIIGQFWKEAGTPMVAVRMVDIGRSGIAGHQMIRGQPGQSPNEFARIAADSLRNQVQAGEEARECGIRRDRSDFRGARDRAERAFRSYPNHPAAAECVAYVFEATQQPDDSITWAYEKVVAGDSLLERWWERLARRYLTAGDTVASAEAFTSQLVADPGNAELRGNVIGMWIELEDYDRALTIADEGLQRAPGTLPLLQLRARACIDGAMWACALQSLSEQYQIDDTRIGDTLFYLQTIGAATQAADTASMLQWTGEATRRVPENVQFWRLRAQTLSDAGQRDGALNAYRRVIELDPDDTRAPMASAQMMLDGLVIDSGVPLDTATMMRADELLTRVAEASAGDSRTLDAIAFFYFQPATKLVQARIRPELGIDWLQKVLRYDSSGRLTTNTNFFLGLATVFHLGNYFPTLQARATAEDFESGPETESCLAAKEYEAMVLAGKAAMTAGASVQQSTANTILGVLEQYEGTIPNFNAAYCGETGPDR